MFDKNIPQIAVKTVILKNKLLKMYIYRKLSPKEQREIVEERIKSGIPAHQPPHPTQDAEYYLLTAACFEHKTIIAAPERQGELLALFTQYVNKGMLWILAWVFLANHYHLLVRIDDFKLLGLIFKNIHGRSSYIWNKEDNTSGRKVWYRYSDRFIRNENHFYTTLNYIHFNPVKHGYVQSPYDWSCSSVHWYKRDKGVDWLRDIWSSFPLKDYGKGWDDL